MIRQTAMASIAFLACTACSDSGSEGGLPLFAGVELNSTFVSGIDGSESPVKDITMRLQVVGTPEDGLATPQDLAFNPTVGSEMWVVSRDDDSATIYRGMQGGNPDVEHIVDPAAGHFMDQVSSIAWGAGSTFATCQDSNNGGNDFMGPALWDGDPAIFGESNPVAVEEVGNLGSHIDMLHQSPNCMGIAWEQDNAYWVFDGFHSAIVRYDFASDHGVGFDDHGDGEVVFWVEGEVERVEGVVSHLAFDHMTDLLYIADTGNNRVAVLDTRSGRPGAERAFTNEPLAAFYTQDNGDIQTFVEGDAIGMKEPAGIELHDGLLYVTDAQTGMIHVFDLEGNEIDRARTGRRGGSLAGIYATSADELWIVDSRRHEVLLLEGETTEVDATE